VAFLLVVLCHLVVELLAAELHPLVVPLHCLLDEDKFLLVVAILQLVPYALLLVQSSLQLDLFALLHLLDKSILQPDLFALPHLLDKFILQPDLCILHVQPLFHQALPECLQGVQLRLLLLVLEMCKKLCLQSRYPLVLRIRLWDDQCPLLDRDQCPSQCLLNLNPRLTSFHSSSVCLCLLNHSSSVCLCLLNHSQSCHNLRLQE